MPREPICSFGTKVITTLALNSWYLNSFKEKIPSYRILVPSSIIDEAINVIKTYHEKSLKESEKMIFGILEKLYKKFDFEIRKTKKIDFIKGREMAKEYKEKHKIVIEEEDCAQIYCMKRNKVTHVVCFGDRIFKQVAKREGLSIIPGKLP